ncbi:MAG: glutathione S-transferase family protein [Rhodoferax sp.]|nr:glutathione S-transferase family protein [Rhodoferax sp.]MCP5264179.1 glutathione S-transferase family protein [Rhodoferax sp.]
MIRLYDYELSGNCYKLRLLMHWLGLPFERVPVDFHPGRAHKSDAFVQNVNPLGQLPVLDDDGFVLRDAQAGLVYLASRYDTPGGHWYPDDAQARGRIQLWLSTADDLTRSISAVRLHHSFGLPADIARCEQQGHTALRLLDDTLAEHHYRGQSWLAGREPSIADIACFPYAALAGEARLDLRCYPALQAWIHAMRHRPGFIAMPGIIDPAL